jgi:hypothetical protein
LGVADFSHRINQTRLGGGAGKDAFCFYVFENGANWNAVREFGLGIDDIANGCSAIYAFAQSVRVALNKR